jgi:hypothetical protein
MATEIERIKEEMISQVISEHGAEATPCSGKPRLRDCFATYAGRGGEKSLVLFYNVASGTTKVLVRPFPQVVAV